MKKQIVFGHDHLVFVLCLDILHFLPKSMPRVAEGIMTIFNEADFEINFLKWLKSL
jgi:hypothetical protein